MRHFHSIYGLYLVLVTCPVMGQDNIRTALTPEHYSQFGTLWPQKISAKGNWVSFAMQYDSGKDTLFVKQSDGKPGYSYASGRDGQFVGDGTFLCLVNDTLVIQYLSKGKAHTIKGAAKYRVTANSRHLLVFRRDYDGTESLSLWDINGNLLKEYGKVTALQLNEAVDRMVYCTAGGDTFAVRIANLNSNLAKEETIISGSRARFSNPVWKKQTIAFTSLDSTPELFSYNVANKTLKRCPNYHGTAGDMTLSGEYGSLFISEDQQRVFFHLMERKLAKENAAVEIWNSFDRQLYPNKKRYGDKRLVDKLAVWQLTDNRIVQLTDRQHRFQTLNGTADKMISSTATDDLSLHLQHENHNVWVTDIVTGNRKMILPAHSGAISSIIASPRGHYISYPGSQDWWVYDLAGGDYKNVTRNLPFPVFNENHNKPSSPEPYGLAGWLEDDAAILLYDKYDIWKVSPSGKHPVRLTFGREKGLSYRIADNEAEGSRGEFSNVIARKINLRNGLLLEVMEVENQAVGYSVWHQDQGVRSLVEPQCKASHLYKAALAERYMFMEQDFHISRRLMSISMPGSKRNTLYQSNPQQERYLWGHSEKITFNFKEKKLQGALYYPAGFSKGKKYPMIVQVYERQSPYVHEFTPPTYFEQGGFNITNYTSNGYFVLLPDIVYEYGATGKSATESVIAAVDGVLSSGHILADKIGLIGHSFGGYETDIIITKTNRFATAVSGSAWTDLISGYYHIGKNTMTADFWRYEQDQLRLGVSPFDDVAPYIENSPVLKAAAVTTPLLSWVGLKDESIDPCQSIEFHLALRRLGKRNTLLVYPTEYHIVLDAANQKDLSIRIEQWFGHFLKGEAVQSWMLPD